MEHSSSISFVGTILFALAIVHTFSIKMFQKIAMRFREGSVAENLFHLIAEVEVVFGIWAAALLVAMTLVDGSAKTKAYIDSLHFSEPVFVFAILVICASRPIMDLAESLISKSSRLLVFFFRINKATAYLLSILILGPVLGSFITEPAAMTVSALLLLQHFFLKRISDTFKYAILAVLFVNVSIGGTLTPYAAPPILVVAKKWNWGLHEMLLQFGWKGFLSCVSSAILLSLLFQRNLKTLTINASSSKNRAPIWVQCVHLVFLVALVLSAHHPILVIGVFLFFLGFYEVSQEHQHADGIRLKQGLLVAFFLAGLIVLGGVQQWWLAPLLGRLDAFSLFVGSVGLTAITDNAALTYLGSLVPELSNQAKYALVAGAVTGGGLTVIANAPNPVGFSILQKSFGQEGINPIKLFAMAVPPTIIAAFYFWYL